MVVRFGLALPPGPPKNDLSRFTGDLETIMAALGDDLDSVWMTDHFFWEDEPTYEAWTVMSYLLGRYPNIKVGSAVLGQSYRNPALLAKAAATIHTLSGGRLIMGIGAGWKEDEYHAYGYEYPRPGIRIEQLEDTLEIMTRMWKEPGKVTYEGKYYHIKDAYCEPKPDPIPQIIVGGGGRKTMMLAARFADGWNIPDSNFEKYSERYAVLREHCETIGRDPAEIELSWFGRLSVALTEEEAMGYSNGKWTSDNAIVGTPEQVREQIDRFADLGVELFQVEILGLPESLDLVKNEVIGKLRA